MLGLSNNLIKAGLAQPGIITDSLVLKHKYDASSVELVSDGAASFGGNGTSDRIEITETVFNVDGDNYTFAFWAKRNELGVVHTVLGKSTTSNESMIRFNTSNQLKIESNTNNDIITMTLNTIDRSWHHYAITITSSGATVVTYQDGAICSNSGNVGDDNMTIDMIGAQNTNGGDYEMDGYLCNIGIWTAVLTQAQIKSIMWKNYAKLTDSEKTNLVSWWNLDSSYIVADVTHKTADSHGSNHGTLS